MPGHGLWTARPSGRYVIVQMNLGQEGDDLKLLTVTAFGRGNITQKYIESEINKLKKLGS